MKPYEILEHVTDLEIRAFGKTKEELFSNMLKGMFEAVKPQIKDKRQKTKVEREIKIKSVDEQSLLVDFLSEALAESDINNEAYFEAKFDKLTDKELEGKIFGWPVENFALEIKAVTYHGLYIKKVGGRWEAKVLFDI
jgi:SHS2 domain-containing protein